MTAVLSGAAARPRSDGSGPLSVAASWPPGCASEWPLLSWADVGEFDTERLELVVSCQISCGARDWSRRHSGHSKGNKRPRNGTLVQVDLTFTIGVAATARASSSATIPRLNCPAERLGTVRALSEFDRHHGTYIGHRICHIALQHRDSSERRSRSCYPACLMS